MAAGSLGYVYVAYANFDDNTDTWSIWLKRSTDGGLTFPNSFVLSYGPSLGAPQVISAPGTGYVYVFWADYTNDDIRMARSTDFGLTFGAHEIAGTKTFKPGVNEFVAGGVRARTVPMARFNWPANRLAIVWHGRGTSPAADVYYAYKPCSSNCNVYGWSNPIRLNDTQTADQFMPALDYNSSGNTVVSFYGNHEDTVTGRKFHRYYAYINSTGGALQANQRISTALSDPWHHTNTTGQDKFIGDYQDVWDMNYMFGARAVSTGLRIPSATIPGEVDLTRITY